MGVMLGSSGVPGKGQWRLLGLEESSQISNPGDGWKGPLQDHTEELRFEWGSSDFRSHTAKVLSRGHQVHPTPFQRGLREMQLLTPSHSAGLEPRWQSSV